MTCNYKDCARPRHCRGLCIRHYTRQQRGKDMDMIGYDNQAKRDWISALVLAQPSLECVDWPWGTDGMGYAQISIREDGRDRKVGHLVLEATGRPRPDLGGYHGAVMRHSCDRKRCCAPWHISWSTQAENMQDTSPLTPDQVEVIRRRYADGGVTQVQLGTEYGVSNSTIHLIVRGKTWRSEPVS